MIAAKRQWLEEKEQQVEEEVALAKVHWEKEEKEVWNLGQWFVVVVVVVLLFCLFSEGELVCRQAYALLFCHLKWLLRICHLRSL